MQTEIEGIYFNHVYQTSVEVEYQVSYQKKTRGVKGNHQSLKIRRLHLQLMRHVPWIEKSPLQLDSRCKTISSMCLFIHSPQVSSNPSNNRFSSDPHKIGLGGGGGSLGVGPGPPCAPTALYRENLRNRVVSRYTRKREERNELKFRAY